MQEMSMRYGQFLRTKRISDSRELTLKDVAGELGVSVSFVSDVEQGRRKPYDEEKTEKLIEFLKLTEEEIALMNDLAARESFRYAPVPEDIKICKDAGDLESVAFLRGTDLPDQSGA
jgi:transcriptional regulator with XRE-family HTH domain